MNTLIDNENTQELARVLFNVNIDGDDEDKVDVINDLVGKLDYAAKLAREENFDELKRILNKSADHDYIYHFRANEVLAFVIRHTLDSSFKAAMHDLRVILSQLRKDNVAVNDVRDMLAV